MTILVDPDDDYRITHAALQAHDVANGVLTVHPTVGISAMVALAQDILVALGKRPAVVVKERVTATAMWMSAAAWVKGAGIRQLVILRAHRLSRPSLARLVHLAADANASLTLVWHAQPPVTWEGVLPAATIKVVQGAPAPIVDQKSQPPAVVPAVAPEQRCSPLVGQEQQKQIHAVMSQALPEVPRSNVLHFRADTFRALSREDFARVDLLYTSAMDAACAFLSTCEAFCDEVEANAPAGSGKGAEQDGRNMPNGRVAGELKLALDHLALQVADALPSVSASLPRPWKDHQAVTRFVAGLVATAPSLAHTLALLRGAQAGFLLHGVHLAVPADPEKLGGPGFADPPLTPAVAEQIRSHIVDPVRAGALAVFLATGLSTWRLSLTYMSMVAPDASTVGMLTPVEVHYPIPVWARDLLAAAHAFVALQNFGTGERFLATGIGVEGQTLADTAQRCGLRLGKSMLAERGEEWHLLTRCFWVAAPLHPRAHAARTIEAHT
ncbi:hypothetical protein [Streptosporangium sp. V21-05]|uniref:hypothetical protein n=1 Tax=Streptosporangium sp. V21-05 TaxID=3446115 RepID=UPI003F53C074